MNKFIVILILILLVFLGRNQISTRFKKPHTVPAETRSSESDYTYNKFRCDGRIHCSQMTSCEEAEFFLKNCPGVKMDGDGDGIPCERQWCR